MLLFAVILAKDFQFLDIATKPSEGVFQTNNEKKHTKNGLEYISLKWMCI